MPEITLTLALPEGVKKLDLSRHPGEPRIKSGAGTGVQAIRKTLNPAPSGTGFRLSPE